ncbi:MAG: hypothetical protein IKF90_07350 [Parasporobacterium sp.]|nr:hypothetical protein [Parasporobacterium sp.]
MDIHRKNKERADYEKSKKRVLSMMIVLILIISMPPMQIFAAEGNGPANVNESQNIEETQKNNPQEDVLFIPSLSQEAPTSDDANITDPAQGNDLQGNELQEDQLPGNKLSNDDLPGNALQGNELQEDKLQGNKLSDDELPGNALQGNELPNNELPENTEPGDGKNSADDLKTADDVIQEDTNNEQMYGDVKPDDKKVFVEYIRRSWNGTAVESKTVTEMMSVVPDGGKMTSGKYYLDRNLTLDERIFLTGDTELVLGDGNKLDVKGLYIPVLDGRQQR